MADETGLPTDHELVGGPPGDDSEGGQHSNDGDKPGVPLKCDQLIVQHRKGRETHLCDILTGDMHVHAPETRDEVHGNEHRTERGQLREHVVDLVVGVRHLDRDLREVVAVRAREDLLVVVQVLRHRDQVVLDIREVETLDKEPQRSV